MRRASTSPMTICAAHLASFPGCVGPGNEAGDISQISQVWTVTKKLAPIAPHRIWFKGSKISYRIPHTYFWSTHVKSGPPGIQHLHQ